MYINKTMDGRDEPTLRELIAEPGEVMELIIEAAISGGSVPSVVIGLDDITADDIEIETAEYVTHDDILVIEDIVTDNYDGVARALIKTYFKKKNK